MIFSFLLFLLCINYLILIAAILLSAIFNAKLVETKIEFFLVLFPYYIISMIFLSTIKNLINFYKSLK